MDNNFLDNFFEKTVNDPAVFSSFFTELRAGDNSVIHNKISQSVMLDDSWIITLEQGLESVEQIVRRPRKFIAESDLIVDVEKVRRTTNKTVRHLTTHSQYIQNIDNKTGEVRPKKLLSVDLEEDLAIYENRFVCALINRLIRFVEQRNSDLEGQLDTYEQTNVKMRSAFNYGDSHFECNIELKVNEPPENVEQDVRNKQLFERVQTLRRRLRVLQGSSFMQSLAKTKPVRPPIQKTNLLTKNVDYNNCYNLWLFISSYNYLGYSVTAKDKNLPMQGDYYDDLTVLAAMSLQTLITNNVINRSEYMRIKYTEPVEKDFNLVTSLTFDPPFGNSAQKSGEETINEYYFRKMKDDLVRASADGDVPVEKRLDVNFVKFFRSVARINDEMYDELIEEQIQAGSAHNIVDEERVKFESLHEKKKEMLRQQKERLKRRKLYLKLKWEEVERAQRLCERTEAKYNKMKEKYYAELREKQTKRVTKRKLKVDDKKDKETKN